MLGKKIKEARERLNLSQEELAVQAKFTLHHQVISAIERGERDIKAWELAKIAEALRINIMDLLSSEEVEASPIVLWRNTPQQRETKEADFLLRCKQYQHLETLIKEGGRPPQFPWADDIDLNSLDYAETDRLADNTRKALDLGSRPASALVKVLESKYRVKIWYQNLEDDGSAACVVGEDFGPAILMNLSEAPWRRNYNFAHELFHLITWKNISPGEFSSNQELWAKIEKLANAFASSLLLPADEINYEFNQRLTRDGKIRWADLIEIARDFDVSIEALLWRLVNLRYFDANTVNKLLQNQDFRLLDKDSVSANWWEPSSLPERFVMLAFFAYKQGKLSRSKLAQYLGTSLIDLSDKLLKCGYDEEKNYETEVLLT